MGPLRTILALACAAALVPTASASAGDYSPTYKRCVAHCSVYRCVDAAPSGSPDPPLASFPTSPIRLSRRLRLLGWSCPDECSYQCMHHLTDLALGRPLATPAPGKDRFAGWWEEADWKAGSPLEGLPPGRVVQFHGKWPFRRRLGLQEPLSVLFSLLNLSGYLRSWRPVERETRRYPPLRGLYLGVVALGVNMWLWSTVFHARDKAWSERADYFSAAAYNLWGMYVAIVRVFRLHPSPRRRRAAPAPAPEGDRPRLSSRARASSRRALLVVIVIMFGAHVMYLLSDKRFDYRYNIIANVAVSLVSLTLWCGWSLSHHLPSSLSRPSPGNGHTLHSLRRPSPTRWAAIARSDFPHTLRPWLISTWLIVASTLELLDFAPLFGRSLDAHALWHLSTVPLARLWCVRFLARDAKLEADKVRDMERVRQT